jgi:hypothetical protein
VASFEPGGTWVTHFARKVTTNGNPDDLDYVHVKLQVWLKRKVLAAAKRRGQSLTEYIRALCVADVGERDVRDR